jgi:hypothetical protein
LRIFFARKNQTASARFEPASLGTKGQHATSRPPKPLALALIALYCLSSLLRPTTHPFPSTLFTPYRTLSINATQQHEHMATGRNRIKATEFVSYWITHHAHMNSFQTANLWAASFDAHL